MLQAKRTERKKGRKKSHLPRRENRAAVADGEMLKLKAGRKTHRLVGAATLPLCERSLFISAATPSEKIRGLSLASARSNILRGG